LLSAVATALFWGGGTVCEAHVIPVIRSSIQVTGSDVILRENADIRILLDKNASAHVLTRFAAGKLNRADSLALIETCSAALASAVTVKVNGATASPERNCRIETTPGPDGEPDYLLASEAAIILPADDNTLEISLDPLSPASLILSVTRDDTTRSARNQVLFAGERGRPISIARPRKPLVATSTTKSPTGIPATNAVASTQKPTPPALLATSPDTPDQATTLWGFLRLGFRHILPDGLDHILFIVGLFLFSYRFRPLLLQVTVFTLAHSITLALSALEIYRMDGRLAEPLIAASIIVVGVENCLRRKDTDHTGPLRLAIVFGFGLIHGLGIANMLAGYQLGDGFLLPLIGFNIGVEVGQITVLGICFGVLGRTLRLPFYRHRIAIPLSLLITLIGSWWLLERCLLTR
jgi:hydrogenase/urease accessory protein HupE